MTPSIVCLGPSPTSLHPTAYFPLGSQICMPQTKLLVLLPAILLVVPIFVACPAIQPLSGVTLESSLSPTFYILSISKSCLLCLLRVILRSFLTTPPLRPPSSDFPLVLLQQPPNWSCFYSCSSKSIPCTSARVIFKDRY